MRPIPTQEDPNDPADRSLIEWWRRRLRGKPAQSTVERGGSRGLLIFAAVVWLAGILTCCWGLFLAVHR